MNNKVQTQFTSGCMFKNSNENNVGMVFCVAVAGLLGETMVLTAACIFGWFLGVITQTHRTTVYGFIEHPLIPHQPVNLATWYQS